MTAAGEPLRLYPTRRDPAPRPGDPEWVRAKETEKARSELMRTAKQYVSRLQRVLDDVEVLDRDGYLEVAIERVQTYHGAAVEALFELTTELAELVDERPASNAKARVEHIFRVTGVPPHLLPRNELVDEQPDEPSDPAACTCAHPECGAC